MSPKLNKVIVGDDGLHYKWVAPDGGGCACITAVGLVLVMISVAVPGMNYGLIYGDFFREFNLSLGGAGIQNGLAVMSFSIASLCTGLALKAYSIRVVGMVGACIYTFFTFLNVFMTTLPEFVIEASLAAFGGGIMFNCSMTAFNQYFDKKKFFLISMCQTIISIVQISSPQLVAWSVRKLNWQGTLLCMTALFMQTIVVFALYQPVEKHLILERVQEEEPDNPEKEPLKEEYKSEKSRMQSNKEEKPDEANKKSMLKSLAEYLDLSLLRVPMFIPTAITLSMDVLSDFLIISLLPLQLETSGWSKGEVASLMTILSVADTISRVALTVLSRWQILSARTFFLVFAYIALVFRFSLTVLQQNKMAAWCLAAGVGLCRGITLVVPPVIMAELAGARFSSAQGLQQLFMGTISMSMGFVAGALKDYTGSYSTAFHIMSVLTLLCLTSWTLKLLLAWRKTNRKNEASVE